MNSIDKLIPFAEAIEMAGMKSTKAYDEVAAGRLAIVKNGRRSFIRESELRRFIDALRLRSPARTARPETKRPGSVAALRAFIGKL